MQRASDYLAQEGPFYQQVSGYQVRDNQLALCDAIDEAIEKGWTVIDMKNDWKVVYPFERSN